MSTKRFDLQGIRAWAVVAVVLFHFASSIFPWGYLGVDVFFVLSGFLISMVLEKKPCLAATYIDFYFKRVKRILPLALLVALMNLLFISQNDELDLVKLETRSALFAVFFLTNFNGRDEGAEYFAALENANDYFTHYWSLSVEIQFYVFAPILLHILKPSWNHPTRMMTYLSSIWMFSFVLSIYFPSEKAFSSTLCRFWQFLSGAIAFNLNEITAIEKNVKNEAEIATIITSDKRAGSAILMYVVSLGAVAAATALVIILGNWLSLLRLIITLSTAFLIYWESGSPVLCHNYLQLLGDASYALYLVHWPVVCLLKQSFLYEEVYIVVVAIIACIVISILLHLIYEKWQESLIMYLFLSEYRLFTLMGVLYLACFSLIYFNEMRKPTEVRPGDFNPAEAISEWQPGSLANFTEEEVNKMNKYMDVHAADLLMFPHCTSKEKSNLSQYCSFPNGRGNLSFLMIGNSYAFSTAELVRKHFIDHYERMSTRAAPWCEPLIETNRKSIHEIHRIFLEDVKRENPDVLFISTRYENPESPIEGNVTADPLYLYMLNKLKEYEQYVAMKIFILDSFPLLHSPSAAEKKRRWRGLPMEGFMPEAIKADDAPMRLRTKEVTQLKNSSIHSADVLVILTDRIAKHCDKCVVYSIRQQHLNEKGQFMTIDPSSHLRFFDRTIHYTPVGVKLIEPVFVQLSKEFDRLLNATFPENVFELKK